MGNARNIGLEADIGLTSMQYQIASASFYIGTVLFGTIGGLMLKVVKPSTWLGVCAIGWGAVSTLQAACTNAGGLIAVRFFLGVFEASFAPGCALYLSFWYLKSELSLRIALYAGMSALSGVISGIIAYGMGLAQNMAVTPWQALFIIEGLPTGQFELQMSLAIDGSNTRVCSCCRLPHALDFARPARVEQVPLVHRRRIQDHPEPPKQVYEERGRGHQHGPSESVSAHRTGNLHSFRTWEDLLSADWLWPLY